MSLKILKKTITNNYFTFNAMFFLPTEQSGSYTNWAIFTHGYTASKSDCINWAQRIAEINIPTVIFDLPGHHLGSYNSVSTFDDFKNHAHECFIDAYHLLKEYLPDACAQLILGGHSLGALLAIKALELKEFKNTTKLAIAVGIGIGHHKTVHLFESSFYEKTLMVRRQLVDENLDSDIVFPWIKDEKFNLDIRGERIHFITGLDDIVVGEGGTQTLVDKLNELENTVSYTYPRKLPHHEPSKAATYIYNFLKNELKIN